jgi:hypothetical protein
MDDLRGLANMVRGAATATSTVDAFWFSFTYYAGPALLGGGETA